MNIPIEGLCAAGAVASSTYRRALAGGYRLRPGTLARLGQALEKLAGALNRRGPTSDLAPLAMRQAFRAALVVAAGGMRADPRAALAADPARKATADAVWAQAARVRMLAYWLANGQMGFSTSDIARAAGVTKQAVSEGIRKVEDAEDLAAEAGRQGSEEAARRAAEWMLVARARDQLEAVFG